MRARQFPLHGWLGLLLIAIIWPISWLRVQPLAEVSFFPLWLGYILAVDGLVLMRRGSSLLVRSRLVFAGLFLASAPVWWLFEFFNGFIQNWVYLGAERYGQVRYFLQCEKTIVEGESLMFHSSHLFVRRGLLLPALAIVAGAWRVTTAPVFAQSGETPTPSMVERFFGQPDLAAPLVVPMILALGGVLALIAFLGWALNRMPENR